MIRVKEVNVKEGEESDTKGTHYIVLKRCIQKREKLI